MAKADISIGGIAAAPVTAAAPSGANATLGSAQAANGHQGFADVLHALQQASPLQSAPQLQPQLMQAASAASPVKQSSLPTSKTPDTKQPEASPSALTANVLQSVIDLTNASAPASAVPVAHQSDKQLLLSQQMAESAYAKTPATILSAADDQTRPANVPAASTLPANAVVKNPVLTTTVPVQAPATNRTIPNVVSTKNQSVATTLTATDVIDKTVDSIPAKISDAIPAATAASAQPLQQASRPATPLSQNNITSELKAAENTALTVDSTDIEAQQTAPSAKKVTGSSAKSLQADVTHDKKQASADVTTASAATPASPAPSTLAVTPELLAQAVPQAIPVQNTALVPTADVLQAKALIQVVPSTQANPVASSAAKVSSVKAPAQPVSSTPAQKDAAHSNAADMSAPNAIAQPVQGDQNPSKVEQPQSISKTATHATSFAEALSTVQTQAASGPQMDGVSLSMSLGQTAAQNTTSITAGTGSVTPVSTPSDASLLSTPITTPVRKLEVSVQDPVLGTVGVQAEMRNGVVHASLSGTQDAVGTALPSLHHYLNDQQIAVNSLTFSGPTERVNGTANANNTSDFTRQDGGANASFSANRQSRRDAQEQNTGSAPSGTAAATTSAVPVSVLYGSPAAIIPDGSTLSIHI